jgi:iron complex transport system substrate-binding protein
MKRVSSILIIFCSFFFLPLSPAYCRLIVDQTGAEIELPDAPRRVLALAPSLTEMVYSLQAEAMLIGATRYSNYPPAALKLPRVGSFVQLDLEKIVAIKPDVCLAIKDGNPRRTIEAIKGLGIPVFAVDPHNIEQIMDALLLLGDILGVSNRAELVVGDMKRRIEEVKSKVAASSARPTVFFQISDMPIVTAGKDSYIDTLISLAGGRNLAGNMTEYPRFSWENIMEMQPEVVLISAMDGMKSPHQLKTSWLRWPQIPAVRDNRLHVVNADLFNRPTVRLIAGLEILAGILHPNDPGEISAE